jgi:hypothetical protein
MYFKATALVLLSLYLLGGCTHGQLSTLPHVSNVDKAATLTVLRESGITGGGVSFRVDLNEQSIAMLNNGTHIIFKVEPGTHSISFSSWQIIIGWMLMKRIEINCLPDKQYYIRYSPGVLGGKLEQIQLRC